MSGLIDGSWVTGTLKLVDKNLPDEPCDACVRFRRRREEHITHRPHAAVQFHYVLPKVKGRRQVSGHQLLSTEELRPAFAPPSCAPPSEDQRDVVYDATRDVRTAEDLGTAPAGIPAARAARRRPTAPPPRGDEPAAATASVPSISWHCPIGLELMRDPVFTACGNTFERACIAEWLQNHDTSPVTGEPLPHRHLVPNQAMRSDIAEWLQRAPSTAP